MPGRQCASMNHRHKSVSIAILLACQLAAAQNSDITITEPRPIPVVGRVLSPFHMERRIVSPARLTDSDRLRSLVRAGNLYLSAQDVIALVLENNLDIAVQRYGPFLAREVLRRAQGGGFLRDVTTPLTSGPVSVSLAGVSVNTAGLAEGTGVGSGGGIVVQYGPTPPNLDPYLFFYASYAHLTTPESNVVLNGTSTLINDYRQYQTGYGQSFVSGSSLQLTFYSFDSKLNSPTVFENPSISGYLDLYVTQNLLQGFSPGVNNRNIRVARNNMKGTELQLKRQVITTVSAVLNLYWDLVSFDEDMRIKQEALNAAQKLYDDNKQQVALGTLPAIEVTRAAAQVSASKEDLLISQTNVAQQETILKNALSRNMAGEPWLDEVHIVPLDHIEVPAKEDLPPTAQLIDEALRDRPELQQTRINLESLQINLRGTRNELLPTLQAFADVNNQGLSGPLNPLYTNQYGVPDPYFIGGSGNLLGQIFRRDFPNYSAGLALNIPFRNRQAQADYITDQLTLRQNQLQLQKAVNQIRVEVKNAVIGLQQARTQYEAAVSTRQLAQQTLDAEQNRFKFGQSTISAVIQAQRDLAGDQSAEVQSMANYTHARIAFEQAIGTTLDTNHITMEEARTGRVPRQSTIPENIPAPQGAQQ